MSDLSNLVDALKRRVAVPGDFENVFPDTSDDDVTGLLMDGFARAQLNGYFTAPSFAMDDNGLVTPDISRAQGSLIVLYAGVQMVQTQLLNLKNRTHYKAGNVEYQTEQGSNILTAVLKQLKDELIEVQRLAATAGTTAATLVADQYFLKAVGPYPGTEGLYYGPEVDRAYDYHEPWLP